MTNQVAAAETDAGAHQTLCRLGSWSAAMMALCAAVALAIGIATPPMSGPGCVSGCIAYPYTAVAFLVPHDYIWMYPAILLAPLFVVLMVCLHHIASRDRKLFTQIGTAFAVIYATVISVDYFVQLSVMQPSLLKGETEGLVLFSMYNPHGVFIALEDLGYLAMSAAFFFIGWVFVGNDRLERALRWLLRVSAVVTVAAFVVMSLVYGPDLEYRFELLAISVDWLMLIVGGVLLSVFFRRAAQQFPSR
jgi:hypothetical protein